MDEQGFKSDSQHSFQTQVFEVQRGFSLSATLRFTATRVPTNPYG
jgi:hypothetical protein